MARKNRLKLNVEKNVLKTKKVKMAYYLNKGLSIKDACVLADVSQYTLASLRSDPDFDSFVRKSDISYENDLLNIIHEAGEMGDWRAVAWILERKYPEKYGKKDTVRHEYNIKLQNFQKIILEVVNSADPELRRLVLQKLREVDISGKKLLEDNSDVVDAEYT